MPALGADMEKGRLVQWCVPAGTHVQPGDIVAVVETQKGAIDVEIFLDGVLEDLVPLGTELPVGAVLAHVRRQDETPVAVPAAPALASVPPASVPPASVSPASVPPASVPPAVRARVSPLARRRARELGVDLASLAGSGPDGVIALADVERAGRVPRAAEDRSAPAGFDPAQMRAAIAAAMGRSKREIPHYYLTQAIDFSASQQWLTAYNEQRAPAERLLAAVLLLKATSLALRKVPQLNGFWRDGEAQLAPSVHTGWAISLRGGGVIAPALHHADRASLPALMVALRDLVERARSGGLRSSELADPTVTITNLGERGADSVLGVIYPPQLALVGFGRIASRPWVANGQLAVRPVVQACLAADHRASDGHLGARFLGLLDAALQDPAALAKSES